MGNDILNMLDDQLFEEPHIINPHRLQADVLRRSIEAMYAFVRPIGSRIATAYTQYPDLEQLITPRFFNPDGSYHSGRLALRQQFGIDRRKGITGPSLAFLTPLQSGAPRVNLYASVSPSLGTRGAIAFGFMLNDAERTYVRGNHVVVTPDNDRYIPQTRGAVIPEPTVQAILGTVTGNEERLRAFSVLFRDTFAQLDQINTDELPAQP